MTDGDNDVRLDMTLHRDRSKSALVKTFKATSKTKSQTSLAETLKFDK